MSIENQSNNEKPEKAHYYDKDDELDRSYGPLLEIRRRRIRDSTIARWLFLVPFYAMFVLVALSFIFQTYSSFFFILMISLFVICLPTGGYFGFRKKPNFPKGSQTSAMITYDAYNTLREAQKTNLQKKIRRTATDKLYLLAAHISKWSNPSAPVDIFSPIANLSVGISDKMVPLVKYGKDDDVEKVRRIIYDFLINQNKGLQREDLEQFSARVSLLPDIEADEVVIKSFTSTVSETTQSIRKYPKILKILLSFTLGIIVYFIGVLFFGLNTSNAYIVTVTTIVGVGVALLTHRK